MSANTNNWAPPVQFHFSVVFKLPSGDTAASFRSVSGIDQTLALQQQAQQGNNDLWLPTGVSHSDIVLSRALEPLYVSTWVNDCMSFKETDKKIEPCTLIISLLDEQKNPVASWECQRAVPHKCKLDDLNAESSGLAIESITIHTPAKNTITMSDEGKSITVADQNKNKVVLDNGGIELSSVKDIKLTAKGNISLSATGKVNIDAKSDVAVNGTNVKVTAKVKGNATAELSASGQTTVKGAMVMIN